MQNERKESWVRSLAVDGKPLGDKSPFRLSRDRKMVISSKDEMTNYFGDPNGIPTCVAYPQNSPLDCFLASQVRKLRSLAPYSNPVFV